MDIGSVTGNIKNVVGIGAGIASSVGNVVGTISSLGNTIGNIGNLGSTFGKFNSVMGSVGNVVGNVIGALDNFMEKRVETMSDYINITFNNNDGMTPSDNSTNYFYQQFYRDFNPDINGYTICFLVPPDLSGYRINKAGKQNVIYNQTDPESFVNRVSKMMCFAAIDYTPPQSQITSESVKARTGGISYASEVNESDSVSITIIDNQNLDIYGFHHLWVEYIREILEGTIAPDKKYYENTDDNYNSYFSIDYAASLYIVKYYPSMKQIKFISKCTGIYPQSLPSKELIGSRGSNELTTLPFTYFCSSYREVMRQEFITDDTTSKKFWIYNELYDKIYAKFNNPPSLEMSGIKTVKGTIDSVTSMYDQGSKLISAASSGISNFKFPLFK